VNGDRWGCRAAKNVRVVDKGRVLGVGAEATEVKLGPDHTHGASEWSMIGPDLNHTFFAKNWHLVREKSYLPKFWAKFGPDF